MSDSEGDWVEPGWSTVVEELPCPPLNSNHARMDGVESWAVKLNFKKGLDKISGTGFFVDIPESLQYYVVFTAAHNLTTPEGVRTTDLVLSYPDPFDITDYAVPTNDIYICKSYNDINASAQTDYGFIRIPRDTSKPRLGFGFNLTLAYEDFFPGNLHINGFEDGTLPGKPTESPGSCMKCYDNWIEYNVTNEPGMSGSSVWIEYDGLPIVVAIHNSGPVSTGRGSRGARLTVDLFTHLFEWLNRDIVKRGVQLRTTGSGSPENGLFLSFEDVYFDFARVRSVSGTKFDMMPVAVKPGGDIFYALKLTSHGAWVTFNPVKELVKKSDKMKRSCLFLRRNLKKTFFNFVVQAGGQEFQLLMGNRWVNQDEESSEISFDVYPSSSKSLFSKFWFI